MDKSIIATVARNLHKEKEEVEDIVNEFTLQLHKTFFEYKPTGYDCFFRHELYYHIPKQSFYHLVCFIGEVGENGIDEIFIPAVLTNGGFSTEWVPYCHQMDGWKKPEK